MSDDPIGDALRADADQARAEIRAAGISCPSCGVNMADLRRGHKLAISGGRESENGPVEPWTAQCSDGRPVELAGTSPMDDASFETWNAAVNVSLLDDLWVREDQAFEQIFGVRPTAPAATSAD